MRDPSRVRLKRAFQRGAERQVEFPGDVVKLGDGFFYRLDVDLAVAPGRTLAELARRGRWGRNRSLSGKGAALAEAVPARALRLGKPLASAISSIAAAGTGFGAP